jgi:hypothetical protein
MPYRLAFKLSDDQFNSIEKAAASHPPKRVVNPNWGLDIFEDNV